MVGILMPLDCNMDMLKQLLAAKLKLITLKKDINIQYQINRSLPQMALDIDNSLNFHLELGKKITKLIWFPLWVIIENGSVDERLGTASRLNEVVTSNTFDKIVSASASKMNLVPILKKMIYLTILIILTGLLKKS